jgi:lipopolysaccharide export system permease protein
MIGLSDRYIGRQVLYGTFFTVVVLSLVLVLGNLFKEIRPLLVAQRAPLSLVFRFVLTIIPFSLMFTIPWGFLAAVLLVFGRLSGDNELHAFQMAGRSLARLAMPVFVLGALFSGLCWWLNVNVVPQARASLEDMLYEAVKRDPRALLDPGVVQSHFRNQMVFIERKEGDCLHGFHLYQSGGKTNRSEDGSPSTPPAYVHAGKVSLVVDQERQNLRLTLEDAYLETWKKDGTPEIALSTQAEPWLFDFSKTRFRKPRAAAMSNNEIVEFLDSERSRKLNAQQRVQFRSEITRRNAFSVACFALAFIGIPLGIGARRKDTSSGLALSLAIAGGYFLFTMLAGEWKNANQAAVDAMLWAPNVVCIALGLLLFRRIRFR